MSDKSTSGGPGIRLLLLIPAAAIVARAAMRHHAMTWAEVGESGPSAHHGRHGHRHFAGPGFDGPAGRDLRLPPRIEGMLDAWHARAHAADAPQDEPSA